MTNGLKKKKETKKLLPIVPLSYLRYAVKNERSFKKLNMADVPVSWQLLEGWAV